MKTKIFGGIAVLSIAAAMAFNVSLNLKNSDQMSVLALANVEALAQEPGGFCNDINYVPDRFLEAVASSGTYTCNVSGKLTVGKTVLSGDYTVGNSYPISLETKNCSGVKKGACCDQRQVGVFVVS